MLELVLSKLITHYLKEYIQKIDSSQMEMKIWKGHATFDNLDLLSTALSSHHIPLLIKKGTISHVDLNFPWKKLNSEACIVEIKDVYIVCSLDGQILIQKDLQATEDAIHLEDAKKDFSKEDAKGTWQSLANTVIDNARIDIENIHFRIEIPWRNSNVALGFIIPKISMHTVDENNQQIKVIKRFQILRKLLTLERLSIYFDIYTEPVELNENFLCTMVQLMKSDWPHQYIMSPLTIECLLIHTRNNPDAIQNQLEILTKDIFFSLDFLQCRALLELNEEWKRFSIQRKYAHCLRPLNFESTSDNWLYAHRCAISRAFHHIFKPKLAVIILSNRQKYLKAYRKLHTDTKNPLIKSLKVFDPSLEKLENKIGPQASLFLRQFAEAVTRKENKEKDTSLSALDMSELKGLINTTDQFFKSSSFSMSLDIPSFKLGLNYSVDQPLFTIDFIRTIGELKSTEKEVNVSLKITNLEMKSYFNNQIRQIFNVNRTILDSFLDLHLTIPTSTSASTITVDVAPFMINLDSDALNNTATFFANFQDSSGQSENQDKERKIIVLDVAEQFQKLTTFKNYSMTVNFNEIVTVFPFVHHEENTELRLEISKITISKELNEVIQPDAPSFDMNFNLSFTINQFQFAGLPLISSFTTHFLASVTFYQKSTNIDVNTKFVLDDLAFYMMNFDYQSVMDTIHTILSLEIFNLSAPEISSDTKTVMSFTRTQFDFQLLIKEFMIQMKDDRNDTKVFFRDITNKSAIFKTNSEFSFLMKSLMSVNNDVEELNLTNDEKCCELVIKKSDFQIHIYNSEINLDFPWIQWIQRYILNFISSISDEDITSIKDEVSRNKNKHKEGNDDYKEEEENKEEKEDIKNEEKVEKEEAKNGEKEDVKNDENEEAKDVEKVEIEKTKIQIILHDSQLIYKDPSGDILFPFSFVSVSSTEDGYFIDSQSISITYKNLAVLSPASFNVTYKSSQYKSEINSDLPFISMQICPSAFHSILRFVFDLKDYVQSTLAFLADSSKGKEKNNTSNEEMQESIGLYNFTADGIKVEAYENNSSSSSFASIQASKLIVDVQYDSKAIKVIVSLDDVDSHQLFLNDLIGLCAFDQFKLTYQQITDLPDQVEIDLSPPKQEINVRIPFIFYVMKFITSDEYDKPSDSNTKYKFDINLPPSKIFLLGKTKKIFAVHLGSTHFACLLSKNNELQLDTQSLALYVLTESLMQMNCNEKLLDIKNAVSFSFKENLLKYHQSQLDVAFNLPSIYEIINELMSEIGISGSSDDQIKKDLSDPLSAIEEIEQNNQIIFFGIDLNIERLLVKVLPQKADPKFFLFDFHDFQFVLKLSDIKKFSSLFINSINISINDQNLQPTQISEVRSVISFNDSFDPSSETHESIAHLEHKIPVEPFILSKVSSSISLQSIRINYSHRMASAAIVCFVPPPKEINQPDDQKDEQNQTKKSEKSANKSTNTNFIVNIKGEFKINEFKIILWLLEPIATLNIVGFSASRTDRWNAHIWRVEVSSENNSLLRCRNDKDLLTFYKEKKAYYMVFNNETEIFFDDKFVLQLTSYIMWSPLLHIPLSSSSDQPSNMISLPFNLILFIPKLSILVPTKFNSTLHIDFSLSLKLIEETIQGSVLSLSAYFTNIAGNKYRPMIEDLSINAIRKLSSPTSVSITLSISNVQCVVSALDISIFTSIYESILNAYKSLTFSVESSSNSATGVTDITFTSGMINLIICRDNRSSQMFDPLFKLSIPPISFILNSNNENENGNIAVQIQPYIQYFNETTGKWDMIVEPFSLGALMFLQSQVFNVAINVNRGININLPSTAIIQYMNLYNDIDESLSRNDVQSMTFPRFWIQNGLEIEIFIAILPASMNIDPQYFNLIPGQIIPVYNLFKDSKIQVIAQEVPIETFTPQQLAYPTYFSNSICISKKPYKGGTLIQVNTTMQLYNGTSIKIDLFVRDGKDFAKYATVDPNQKYPLRFEEDKSTEFLFVEHNEEKAKHKFQIVKISPNDQQPTTFPFWYGDKQINLIKVMSVDSISGNRIVLIVPSIIAINNLPIPLYIMHSNLHPDSKSSGKEAAKVKEHQLDTQIIEIPVEKHCNLLFIGPDNDKINAGLSIDMSHFTRMDTLQFSYNEIQSIHVFSSMAGTTIDIAVIFEQDKATGQLSIIFFSPVVFFNMTNLPIQVLEDSTKVKEPHSLTIMGQSSGLWCPRSYITDSSTHTVNIEIPGLTYKSIKPFDCTVQARSVIFLSSVDNDQMATPLRYNVTKSERTSIVTFSSFLIVKNELDVAISLQPILSIPKMTQSPLGQLNTKNQNENEVKNEKETQKNEEEKIYLEENKESEKIISTNNTDTESENEVETKENGMYSITSHSMSLGDRIKIPSGESVNVETMTLSGAFLLSVEGYQTTPALSLISQQKAAFRVMSQSSFTILELEVSDTKTSFVSCIRRRNFPTPFLIANCLGVQIEAYHLIPVNPFIIEPHSTSIYAFDEPFSYPSLHVDIKHKSDKEEEVIRLDISLVDDCETMIIENSLLNGKPILLTIQPNSNGTRAIILSQETLSAASESHYYWFFSITVDVIRISIIDLLMREFALISLGEISTEFHIHYGMRVFKFNLGTLQVDDQHPYSQCPVVLHGRKCGNVPFFHLDATSPIGSLWMDNIFYVNATMQRIDAAFDASFISDCFQMAKGLMKPIETAIAPAQARIKPSESTVHINWLEISPIYICASFKGGYSKRPPLFGPIPWYIKLIPSISSARILLPGIVIAHLTDRLKETREKVTGDYKSAAFSQILSILGISGRIMQSFGIADSIARILRIRMHSDLVDIGDASNAMITGEPSLANEPNSLNAFEGTSFDNRRQVLGPFSHHSLSLIMGKIESLDIKVSQTIHRILSGFGSNNESEMQQIGIKIKMVPGCGFGYGVFGILTKPTINPMPKLLPMAGISISRMPRAYPNNHIGKYSLFLSKAQAVIMKNTGASSSSSPSPASAAPGSSLAYDSSVSFITADDSSSDFNASDPSREFTGFIPVTPISISIAASSSSGEKIRMKFRCTMTQNFVCLTDFTVFVLNPTAEKIVSKLGFKEIERVSVRRCQVEMTAKKKKKSILCSTAKEEKAERISTFIKSQQFMAQMFKTSLLE